MTTQTETGAILTCSHEGCGCSVTVNSACSCPGAGDHYTCACGAPMVPKGETPASPLS